MTLADFIFKDKKNRFYFWLAIGLNVAGFIYFKSYWFQPANFSYSTSGLIQEAASNASVGLWPIGYAKVLWFFHLMTHSDTVVVAFQYFFLIGVLLYFFFTLHYFYTFAKNSFLLLFVFLFFDPIFLYLANYITADALFTGVSLLWFTQLIWIIHRPQPYQVFAQAILLFVAFTLSYQAAWYPVIALGAFALSRQPIKWKIIGVMLPLLLIGVFVLFTREANFRETGVRRFSVFSAWREANDALFLYPHVEMNRAQIPAEFLALDDTIHAFFEKSSPKLKTLAPVNGFYYLEIPKTPLQIYLCQRNDLKRPVIDYKKWSSVSDLYSDYAHFLTDSYPWAYSQYFLLSNTGEYLWPRIDKVATYNMEQDTIDAATRAWFHYNIKNYDNHDRGMAETMMGAFSFFFTVVNIAFVAGFVWVIVIGARRRGYHDLFYGLALSAVLLLVNAIGNIWYSPVVLESLLVSMIVLFGYTLLMYDVVEKRYKTKAP